MVPACPPCARTKYAGSSTEPPGGTPRHPLCAPRLEGTVRPLESAMLTQAHSSPLPSSSSITSMQAMPCPPKPKADSFQRSGSTPNCAQRAQSLLHPGCCETTFVSGFIAIMFRGPLSLERRMKYWTCAPGVSWPSGMICEYSRVTPAASPPSLGDRPVAAFDVQAGGNGAAPQVMLVLLMEPAGFTRKQRFLGRPSVANLGSDSWYIDM